MVRTSRTQGQTWICSEFEASPFYRDSVSKDKNKQINKTTIKIPNLSGQRTKLAPSEDHPVSVIDTSKNKFGRAVENVKRRPCDFNVKTDSAHSETFRISTGQM